MRNFGLFISFWLASILLPTNSFALGLGEIEVDSFLNQPLDAKIEVISARPGEVDDLLVTLASRDAFTRAGLSRPRGLSELRFKVLINEEDGTAVVLVTTKKAVKEPFLNFLVEADWAKGRVLREFTVLLDPPFYADTPTPAASSSQTPASPESPSVDVITNGEANASSSITPEASSPSTATVAAASDTSSSADVPAATSSSASMQQSTTEQQTTTEPIAVSGEPESSSASEAVEFIADESDSIIVGDLEVFKGDTLWSIATQFKDSEHSMSQVMLAIQRLNPESFGDTNINFLLAGTVLRAPTAEQLDRISEAEALAEVLEQNGLWDGYVEYLSETTLVSMAGDGGETGADDTSAEQQSNLSLLAPGEGETDTTGTQGDGEDTSELSRQLAFAEEELDAARIENADLESRIAELEATLSKVQELQKMVEIEDDSLAQLQADQAAEAAALEAEKIEAETVKTAVTEEVSAPAEILTEETTDTLIEEMIAVDEEALLEDLLAEAPAIEVVEETTSVAPPAPVIVVESAQEPDSMLDGIIPSAVTDIFSSIGSILLNPILLAGLGGILLLVGGLVVYKRWKSGREFVDIGASDAGDEVTDADGTAIDDDVDFTPIHIAGEEEHDQTAIIMPTSEEIEEVEAIADEEDSTAVMTPDIVAEVLVKESAAEEAPAEEPAVEEQDDTLNEVDVYLAYGLYDNAEDLLIQSLEASPTRADYRSKLLDTYFATKNVNEFVKQAEALKGMGDAANRHWDRVQVMGYELAPDNALFSGAKDSSLSASDLGIAKPEAADFDLGPGDEKETTFGETDFLLGEESDDLIDTESFLETVTREDDSVAATQVIQIPVESDDETPEGSVDDLSDLEFALDGDDEEVAEGDAAESDGMKFELPDITDMGDDDSAVDSDDLSMDFDIDEALSLDDDEPELEAVSVADDEEVQATVIIKPGADLDAVIPEDISETQFEFDTDDEDISDIDTGSEDISDSAAINLGLDDTSDISDEIIMDPEDDTDFSDIDLGMDDIAVDDDEIDGEADGDDFLLDLDSKPAKTDTFAPGDFDDPEEIIPSETDIEGVNIDDIDDLVLPDDVDEVSTKLDLARAFIDMGDSEGARSSLDEVLKEGNEEQKAEAEDLIKQM